MPVEGGVVDPEAAAVVLGEVHRDVGPAQQRLEAVGVLGVQGHADADVEVEEHAVAGEDLVEGGEQPAGQHLGLLAVDLAEHHRELVAAEPRHRVDRPYGALSRAATSWSSRSPTWWPKVSLTSLNRSRSSRHSASPVPS